MSQLFVNNAKSTVLGTVNPGDLIIPVVDAASFPTFTAPAFMIVTLEVAGLIEVVRLAAPGKIGNTLIVDPAGRGWEGTTPLVFPSGTRVEGRITAGALSDLVTIPAAATAAETSARTNADMALATAINTATTNLTNNIASSILAEANARIAADALLAPLTSPALLGVPTAPTATPGTNSTQLATTAFALAEAAALAGQSSPWAAGRTWHDMITLGTRGYYVTYTNTNTFPLLVVISGSNTTWGLGGGIVAYLNGVTFGACISGGNSQIPMTILVPPGSTYRVDKWAVAGAGIWWELY